MTIAVTIDNRDADKTIEVIEKSYKKGDASYQLGPPYAVGPGCSHTFYCYLLRDLIIREQDPHS